MENEVKDLKSQTALNIIARQVTNIAEILSTNQKYLETVMPSVNSTPPILPTEGHEKVLQRLQHLETIVQEQTEKEKKFSARMNEMQDMINSLLALQK